MYVMLLGSRGGWVTPSKKLVVEEEYEHARRCRMPTLIFVQDVAHDADVERLLRLVSDYTDGVFRQRFTSTADLERQVEAAVRRESNVMTQPLTPATTVTSRLLNRVRNRNDTTFRVVLAPERHEEVITPMELESPKFATVLYEIGHGGNHPLFSYSRPKNHRVQSDALHVEQVDPSGRHDSADLVWLSVEESGLLDVEASVTNRRRGDAFASSMVVLTDDLASVLASVFSFGAALFDRLDPHKRHQRFLYGAAILELGYRQITRDATPKSSYGMSISRGNEPLLAFRDPRTLSRADLASPNEEIARTVTLLERASRD